MDQSKLDVAQLQKRDPLAWTALLRHQLEMEDVIVTAVSAEPLRKPAGNGYHRHANRYLVALAHHSDPITFVGKRTGRVETCFYRHIAPTIPTLAPRCWFTHLSKDEGWVVLDDVPNHWPPEKWTPADVEAVIEDMATLHATFWRQKRQLQTCHLPHFIGQRRYNWHELRQDQAIYFEEGPAAAISEHAIYHAGRLAPLLLQAANGLVVMRDLGGWPGILGESHLAAAADLLDDPVPLLDPLRNLPVTLIHGDPHTYRWHLTLFDERRLLGWQNVVIGPGIYDLVCFLEQFELLYKRGSLWFVDVRQERPSTEETIIDSYMLAMSKKLGSQFNARAARQAIPAARCLYVLANWFPYFAGWFAQMPSKYTWQKVNRMNDEQLMGTTFQSIAHFRPYLTAVFRRFLRAYRTL
ncbi:MAG TPA: hypothetical protein VF177_22920 [Anaerolineae bacterium]